MKVTINSPINNTIFPRGLHEAFPVQVMFSRALRNDTKPMQCVVAVGQGFSEGEAANDAFIKKHTFRTKSIHIPDNLFLQK